jgi:Putative adhesin
MRSLALFLTALVVTACSLSGAESAPFNWAGRVANGQAIEIKGVNGGIRAEHWTGGDVEVTALRRGHHSNPDDVQIRVVPGPDGLTVCALYPGEGNECRPGHEGKMNTRNNDVSVEFTVKVPAGVRFVGRTVNGGVLAKDLRADVEAYTVNGRVEVSTLGNAVANTVNGSIVASMGHTNWTETREFRTVNGSIDLLLPSSTSAELQASTVNGGISTDFPLTVHGRFLTRRITGTIGNGGRALKISTVNGSIHLRQQTGII